LLTLQAVFPGGWVIPCLEPVLITIPGKSPATIAGTKGLHSIEHAHRVDAEYPAPGFRSRQCVGTDANTGIVHQQGHRTKAITHFPGELLNGGTIGDVDEKGEADAPNSAAAVETVSA